MQLDDRLRRKPATGLRLMVPNTAGGGYDTTARVAAKVMEDAKIATGVQVFNLPGAGGTVGLQRTVNEKGNGKLAMQMGLGVVGATYTSKSKATLTQTTPLAKLIEEAGAIVVPKNSPYKTINDLVTAWKANPKGLAVDGQFVFVADKKRIWRIRNGKAEVYAAASDFPVEPKFLNDIVLDQQTRTLYVSDSGDLNRLRAAVKEFECMAHGLRRIEDLEGERILRNLQWILSRAQLKRS